MKPNFQLTKVALTALALFSAGLASAPSYGEEAADRGITPAHASPEVTGTLYTMSNAADGNAVLMFNRAANGSLTPAQSFPTGGLGGPAQG